MSESELITLRQAALLLGLSLKRLYQLDDELAPTLVPRGKKTVTRWYRRDVVERAAAARRESARTRDVGPARELDRAAAELATARLLDYAEHAAFFLGVPPADTEAVRERIRDLARRLAR